jgi:periplasmic copper chaperone A
MNLTLVAVRAVYFFAALQLFGWLICRSVHRTTRVGTAGAAVGADRCEPADCAPGASDGTSMTIANSAAPTIGWCRPIAGRENRAAPQLHIEINDNGIMKMRPSKSIDVKANGKATLAPGGMHFMLIDLKHHLKDGRSFPLTLTFEKAGKIDVTAHGEKKAGSMGGMKM